MKAKGPLAFDSASRLRKIKKPRMSPSVKAADVAMKKASAIDSLIANEHDL